MATHCLQHLSRPRHHAALHLTPDTLTAEALRSLPARNVRKAASPQGGPGPDATYSAKPFPKTFPQRSLLSAARLAEGMVGQFGAQPLAPRCSGLLGRPPHGGKSMEQIMIAGVGSAFAWAVGFLAGMAVSDFSDDKADRRRAHGWSVMSRSLESRGKRIRFLRRQAAKRNRRAEASEEGSRNSRRNQTEDVMTVLTILAIIVLVVLSNAIGFFIGATHSDLYHLDELASTPRGCTPSRRD